MCAAIGSGLPGKVETGQGELVSTVALARDLLAALPKEEAAQVRYIHFDACLAMQGVTPADIGRHPELHGVVLGGFTGSIGVDAAQTLGMRWMVHLSAEVEKSGTDAAGMLNVLATAKQALADELGRPTRAADEVKHMLPDVLACFVLVGRSGQR